MLPSKLSIGKIGLVLALMLGSRAVHAADDVSNSANYIMPGCREFLAEDSRKEAWGQAFCTGLISGIAYMIDDICIPDSVTRLEIVRVVVQYIDARPVRIHEDFSKLSEEAMRAAWPCKP